jgi:E3 SUMO-protein ligase RanBP2
MRRETEVSDVAESRINVFQRMLEEDPTNAVVRYGLANELMKLERYAEAITEYRQYLSGADDQGAAYGRLAQALDRTGDTNGAREAYQLGIAAANRHGHPGMARDFQLALEDLD